MKKLTDSIKIGLLQIGAGVSKDETLEKLEKTLDDLEGQPDIIVSPEYLMALKDGDLTHEVLEENAEPIDSGYVNALREKAEDLGCSLVFNIYRKGNNGFYNTTMCVGEEGEIIGKYDKVHMFDAFGHKESDFFEFGENIEIFEWKGYKIGLAVCHDLRFPELFRVMSYIGAEIIIVTSAFYAGTHKSKQWNSIINARAHENNTLIVAVNQPEPHFIGESMIASPLGYEVENLGKEEKSKTVEIDMEDVPDSNREVPINNMTRPEIYKKYKPYRS